MVKDLERAGSVKYGNSILKVFLSNLYGYPAPGVCDRAFLHSAKKIWSYRFPTPVHSSVIRL
jgi:hypothetical protein